MQESPIPEEQPRSAIQALVDAWLKNADPRVDDKARAPVGIDGVLDALITRWEGTPPTLEQARSVAQSFNHFFKFRTLTTPYADRRTLEEALILLASQRPVARIDLDD